MPTPEENEFLRQLFLKHHKKLFLVAADMTENHMTAEDMVAETFEAALNNISSLMIHPNPFGWLFVTLRRKTLNEIRDNQASQPVSLEGLPVIPMEDSIPCLQDLCLEDIPKEFEILIWHYKDHASYTEICQRLHISYDACRARMSRTAKNFKIWYQKENDLPQEGGNYAK